MGRIWDGVLTAIVKDVHGNVVLFILGCHAPRPLSALYALEPSSRALGKGLEVEETCAETD